MINMNLNATVKVKLTPYGQELLEDFYRLFYKEREIIPVIIKAHKPDLQERHTFQMWELMHIFGPKLFMGNAEIPFERNEIFLGW